MCDAPTPSSASLRTFIGTARNSRRLHSCRNRHEGHQPDHARAPHRRGLNWGLVGLFQFDLVAALSGGQDAPLSRMVYTLVGLSALWQILPMSRVARGARRRDPCASAPLSRGTCPEGREPPAFFVCTTGPPESPARVVDVTLQGAEQFVRACEADAPFDRVAPRLRCAARVGRLGSHRTAGASRGGPPTARLRRPRR